MGYNSVTGTSSTPNVPLVNDQQTGKTTKTEETKTDRSNTANEDGLVEVELSDSSDLNSLTEKMQQQTLQQYQQQLAALRQQLNSLDEQRRSLINGLTGDMDAATFMASYKSINDQKRSIYNNIIMLLMSMDSAKESLANSQSITSQINAIKSQVGEVGIDINSNTALGDAMVAIGNSFVGVINNDAQGNAEFSPGGVSQAWCADFVTSVTRRAAEATGTQLPSGFGSSSVAGIKNWGVSNGRFIQTAGQANKAEIIANNIKPGDIMIQEENGSSHTGIVVKVYADGSFDTVEGNTSDSVKNRHYDANSNKLTGFVRVT